MTRKHFVALATALHDSHPDDNGMQSPLAMWEQLTRDIARVCADTNSNFDRTRFIAACTPDGE